MWDKEVTMQAVRQIHKVKDGSVTVQLPVDFPADEVEVIVLPVQHVQNGIEKSINEDEGLAAIQRFLTMNTSHFSAAQLGAYERSCSKLKRWLEKQESPLFGAFDGLIEIADDFDSPAEIEDLFYADNIEPQLQHP